MDPRFLLEDGIGIFTGNELIVKGAIESRVSLITGYPGSPLAEVFDTLNNIGGLLTEHGVVAQIANNEALAAARLNGAQMEEIRAMAVMKSVGLHVAADALALGNMAGATANAGALVVVGDDTWSEGTQVPADSRFLSQHLYMPVMEPATFQEIKDWVGVGFELSSASSLFITYLVTSNQADGGGSVTVSPNRFPRRLNARRRTRIDTSAISSDDRVIIPPVTTVKESQVVEERHPRLVAAARERGINAILHPLAGGARSDLAFVTSGLAYVYLEHALHILGLTGRFPILKLGISYPLDVELLERVAETADNLCVVEEKRAFIEPQVAAALMRLRQEGHCRHTRLWGKRFPNGVVGFPETQGLTPTLALQHLGRLLKSLFGASVTQGIAVVAAADGVPANRNGNGSTSLEHSIDWQLIESELDRSASGHQSVPAVPARTPSFCPGCPHRDSASVIDRTARDFADPEFMTRRGQTPEDLVFHGDIGCYSMLKYPPFSRLMHNLSGMGLGGGTGAGIDPFIDNKQVVFMGDSTFFHTGVTAISDSIKNHQDITYIILDNKTTAMTGHQPTPGVTQDLLGRPTFAQDIERIARGVAGDSPTLITRMDPSQRRQYQELIQDAILRPGVKIIIADKECGITFHRRDRSLRASLIEKHGFLPEERHINISEDACEYCLECTRGTGCNGLTVKETAHGPKVAVDLSTCVADGACTRVEVAGGDKTCPSFEEIIIRRQRPASVDLPPIDAGLLPDPERPPLASVWYAYIAGVGGMGINVVASVLAQAGVRQGYQVQLTNKKGLAIRNGSVYSHLSYAPRGEVISSIIPCRSADVLLGLDVLEAARGVDPAGRHQVASPACTAAVVNTAKTPTVGTLVGEGDFSPESMTDLLKECTDGEQFFGLDLFSLSEHFLGNKLYANIMMLGVAFQRGLLPIDLENLEWAISVAVRRELETNMRAFAMGRRLALDPDYFNWERHQATSPEAVLADRTALLERSHGCSVANSYRALAEALLAAMDDLDSDSRAQLALRMYDLIEYEDLAYCERYATTVSEFFARDRASEGFAATKAVIPYLAKVMAIKDEVYVARLLTSSEKYARDNRRYNVDPERGDRISYRHFTRPHLRFLGRDFHPDIRTRDWQLRLLSRCQFLRRLFAAWWHRDEVEFRDWYAALVNRFDGDRGDLPYATWVEILKLPEEVRGYRSVRSPKMAAARQRAAELLSGRPPATAPGTLSIEPVRASR